MPLQAFPTPSTGGYIAFLRHMLRTFCCDTTRSLFPKADGPKGPINTVKTTCLTEQRLASGTGHAFHYSPHPLNDNKDGSTVTVGFACTFKLTRFGVGYNVTLRRWAAGENNALPCRQHALQHCKHFHTLPFQLCSFCACGQSPCPCYFSRLSKAGNGEEVCPQQGLFAEGNIGLQRGCNDLQSASTFSSTAWARSVNGYVKFT